MAEEVSADVTPSLVEKPQIVDDPPPGMSRRTLLKVLAAQALPGVGSRVQPRRRSRSSATASTSTASRPTPAAPGTGRRIEGLLLNSRMVQGIFDDLNPETPSTCGPTPTPASGTPSGTRASSSPRCPSGGGTACSPSRSTSRAAARRATPRSQPWHNSAFTADGAAAAGLPRPARTRSSTGPTSWGWSSSSGFFYFGQDERLDGRGGGHARGRRRASTGCSTAATATS